MVTLHQTVCTILAARQQAYNPPKRTSSRTKSSSSNYLAIDTNTNRSNSLAIDTNTNRSNNLAIGSNRQLFFRYSIVQYFNNEWIGHCLRQRSPAYTTFGPCSQHHA